MASINNENIVFSNGAKESCRAQNLFIAKVSSFASFGFLLVFSLAFIFGEFVLPKLSLEGLQMFELFSIILFVASCIYSLFLSFKSREAAISSIILSNILYGLAFSMIFASFFIWVGKNIMIYALVYTTIVMVVCAITGFLIKDKTVMTLAKISVILFFSYFVISIAGSLMIWFMSPITYTVLNYIVTWLIGIIIISSNVMYFWQLKKSSTFFIIENLEKQNYNKFLIIQVGALFSSIISTFMLILRILLRFYRR